MTPTGLLIVHSSPAEGADEAEFRRWYSEAHALEMIERGGACGSAATAPAVSH
ncbi:hypothetical protein IU443_12755 [Nocardia farcinica]|uniref:hypothetical protein n=1 Tax=Nocardia farcinica TaxID=37329 RepID=UPI0015F11173|nr:hypothetical protein [Nocardia farcinica]MBA4857530.1 hypothetical protein [Nocardia farcinica]MBC9816171.1 hypothetical protein [Nocardia farcinica]MBF6072402.1 hypothetical protein [Nocardia farcinica]MBF6262426.1 hypothetical protein [Nocardia farcinica]MBF6280966.1 hypothetical protein [Nocardia farcinica]